MHADVGEEFLSGILQTGSEDVDHIVDNEETVVIALAVIDGDVGILLIMTLDVKLQLSQILRLLTGEMVAETLALRLLSIVRVSMSI